MNLPELVLTNWRDTRDALHAYARVLGHLRRELTPPQKQWWHITLHVASRGLTTTPIPFGHGTFELLLNPLKHRVEISVSDGGEGCVPITGQSQSDLYDGVTSALNELGVSIDKTLDSTDTRYAYDGNAATNFWQALSGIDSIFKEFKGTLREESGPVQVFSHHFDVSLNWFSGRLIPGQDATDAEHADEQMNFGFATGDGSIPEAYFYATAYPTPEGLTAAALPRGARWETEGFTGAILPYEQVASAPDSRESLLEFLQAALEAGARLMR